MAEIVYTYENPVNARDIARLAKAMEDGKVIAYPTDVNWAFGAKVTSKKGIERLRALKPSHPKDRPFSLLFSSISQVSEYAEVDTAAYRILKKLFPGPYTVLLPSARGLPKQIFDKRSVVGVRIPERELLSALVEKLGVPIITTSAPEKPDGQPFRYGYEVDAAFGHALEYVAELGGEVNVAETTVVELVEGDVVLVRQGAGAVDDLLS